MPDTASEFKKRAPNCPSLEQLDRYNCGLLSPGEAEEIARHLAVCAECAAAFEEEDTLADRPRVTPNPPSTPQEMVPSHRFQRLPAEPVEFGKYHLLRKIAEGGMGIVYEAIEEPLHRVVALKLVRCGRLAGEVALQRFRTEAQAVARLEHPHIVRIYDYGEYDGAPYISMELMAGGSLAEKLRGQPLPEQEAAQLVATLAQAVQFAHDHRVLHRDLKPANVLLAADGTVKLSDFGLAKLLDADSGHTISDAVLGTPSYMSPEQAGGDLKRIDVVSDVYSLGAILYELLTAKLPFNGKTRADTLELVRNARPKYPSALRPGLSPALEAICLKCLEKEPRHRYATARQLAERLQMFLEGKPIPERPPRWLTKIWRFFSGRKLGVATLVLLSLVTGGGLFVRSYLTTDSAPEVLRAELTPEELRTAFRHRLQSGAACEFRGTEKLPGPWLIFGYPNDRLDPAPQDEAFRIATQGAMIEWTSDPGSDRYRFSVELCHIDSFVGTPLIGIYFGCREATTARGQTFRTCYCFVFSDLEGTVNNREFLGKAKLYYCCFRPGENIIPKLLIGEEIIVALPKKPDGNETPWRMIRLDVTPEGVRVLGPEKGSATPLTFPLTKLLRAQRNLKSVGNTPPEVAAMRVEFKPQSGIGLFVARGAAAFRRVVVEPLPGGEPPFPPAADKPLQEKKNLNN
jgi:serine/threonine protein kinase